jgi:hypothetical protein
MTSSRLSVLMTVNRVIFRKNECHSAECRRVQCVGNGPVFVVNTSFSTSLMVRLHYGEICTKLVGFREQKKIFYK